MSMLLLLLLYFIGICHAGIPLKDELPVGTQQQQQNIKCPAVCNKDRPNQRRPVCGSDGITYQSACHLKHAQCKDRSLLQQNRGKCKPKGKVNNCISERNQALNSGKNIYVPTCRADGRFTPVQCFNGFCWCVNPKFGKPVPNSSNYPDKNNRPTCSRDERRQKLDNNSSNRRPKNDNNSNRNGKSHKDKNQKSCKLIDNIRLIKDVNENLLFDYKRLNRNSNVVANNQNQNHIEWKFRSLDKNKDDELTKDEYKGFAKLLRNSYSLRRCAKVFIKKCDRNRNQVLTLEEWKDCLDIETINVPKLVLGSLHVPSVMDPVESLRRQNLYNQGRILPIESHLPDHDDISQISIIEEKEEEPEEEGCLADRQAVLDEQSSSTSPIYVPECTPDGRYNKTQCYPKTGYCFCVDEDTGKVVPGSSVFKSDPNCDSITPPLKPMKGCREKKKDVFLNHLLDYLRKKMPITLLSTNNSNSGKSDEISIPIVNSEAVANWHFRDFDQNADKYISREEWKRFRNLMDLHEPLKHCGRRLLRHCDANKDWQVSLTEWLLCLGISGQNNLRNKGISNTTPHPRRLGVNPIERLLKAE